MVVVLLIPMKQPGRGFGIYSNEVLQREYARREGGFTTTKEEDASFRLKLPRGM